MAEELQAFTLETTDPIAVAQALLDRRFHTDDGRQGLWWFGGSFYVWYGERRWQRYDDDALFDLIVPMLQSITIKRYSGNKVTSEPIRITGQGTKDIVRFLRSLARYPYEEVPHWMDAMPHEGDPKGLAAFNNCLVDVGATVAAFKETGKIEWVQLPRTAAFFTTVNIDTAFDPTAECPLFDKALEQWSDGTPEWKQLRLAYYGLGLVNWNHYNSWLMEYGEVRGGKGTMARVLKKLLGASFRSVQASQLISPFGLDGLNEARFLMVPEVDELSDKGMSQIATLLKMFVGKDEGDINVKHVRQIRDARFNLLPVLQSNERLTLPNTKRGLSSKMLPLVFKNSFLGKEDLRLQEKLMEELPGIARRLLEALVRLEAIQKWPMPETGRALLRQMERDSNPFDHFLEDRCTPSATGFVSKDKLRKVREEWESLTGNRIETKQGYRMKSQHFPAKLVEGSTWDLTLTRANDGTPGVRGLNVLRKWDPEDSA